MNIAIKINRLLDDLYPDRTMTVYLKTLKSEIEKLVDSENKLQNKDLIAYLKIKGYSKFADSFETPIPKAVTEAEETDFNLDDIFTSKEYEKEINSVKNYNSHRHNGTLFEKLSTAHDEEIIEQLVRNNQSLVHKVAARYQSIGGSHSFEDLVNEGNIGLLKAISKYDITLGYEFSTYAVSWIRQTITRSIMDHGNIVRVPVHMHETIAKIKKIEREIIDEFPDIEVEEILEKGDISLEKYHFAKTTEFRYLHNLSLNQTLTNENDEEYIDFISTCGEHILSPDVYKEFDVEQRLLHEVITEELTMVLEKLTVREREIIEFRFGLIDGRERTLEEVGKIYNLTRERIRQIEAKAFRRIRVNPAIKEIKSLLQT